MEDFSGYQDVLGQMTFLKTYAQIVLGFHLSSGTSEDEVIQEINRATSMLIAVFPWLAGHVVREGSRPNKTGLAKIVLYKPNERPTPVIVKDCSQLLPSFDEIMQAGGPMKMLDGEVLSSRKGLPDDYDESVEPAPVIVIQANFVKGGMLLSFAAQHNIMDMNGQAQMIRMFAKVCRGEPLAEKEIEEGNRDRRDVIRLLGPDEKKVDLSAFRPQPCPALMAEAQCEENEPPKLQWVYFRFPGPKLAQLKSIVTESCSESIEAAASWASTDDILSAFVCQHIVEARIKRLGKPGGGTATISRAVNIRRYLEPPLPPEYLGHMAYCVEAKAAIDSLAKTHGFAMFARKIRSSLQSIDSLEIRTFATELAANDDKGALMFGASLDVTKFDMIFSSWLRMGLYQIDFGKLLGGKPVLAKRPRFVPSESLTYLMPRTDDGDVDVAVCLRVEDIQSLKVDGEFMAFAEYIG